MALHQRLGSALLAALVAAVAVGCGGGGGQVEPFVPTRVLAFGDEVSTIAADGRKHGINAFKITDSTTTPPTESTTEIDCARNPIWIQSVAATFGLVFDRCRGSATATSGQVLAQPGAKVADFAAQRAAVQGNALSDKDLVIAMFGMNDILELYASYPTVSRAALLDEARARGAALGAQVNAITNTGAPVVIVTMHDLGLTPFALNENTATGDTGRAALLTELTAAFNNRMSVTLINDGRLIGLVYADVDSQRAVKLALTGTNTTAAACQASAAPPACTTSTLVEGATSTSHVWASALMPGPTLQATIGSSASFRARNNPF